jgi:YD repeat-containing protein
MKIFLLPVFLLCSFVLQAQYYYNDIVGTQESNRQMKTYLANKVKMMSATGYTPQGSKATDFAEVHEIKENGNALKISRNSDFNHSVFYQRFDAQGRLISITDSSVGIQSTTTYDYDDAGRIGLIQNTIKDTATDFNQVELHKWLYAPDGKVDKMWRIINGSDSLQIIFKTDEDGNIGDEKTLKNSVESAAVYYYYDNKKRLTDIVRYNTRLKKLIPDIMFEYDDNDRVVQKITTTSSLHLGYLIWRYIYDDKGLKIKEALFNNSKELTGKIEYSYTFGQ